MLHNSAGSVRRGLTTLWIFERLILGISVHLSIRKMRNEKEQIIWRKMFVYWLGLMPAHLFITGLGSPPKWVLIWHSHRGWNGGGEREKWNVTRRKGKVGTPPRNGRQWPHFDGIRTEGKRDNFHILPEMSCNREKWSAYIQWISREMTILIFEYVRRE